YAHNLRHFLKAFDALGKVAQCARCFRRHIAYAMRLQRRIDHAYAMADGEILQALQSRFADSALRIIYYAVERHTIIRIEYKLQIGNDIFNFSAVVKSCAANHDVRYI